MAVRLQKKGKKKLTLVKDTVSAMRESRFSVGPSI